MNAKVHVNRLLDKIDSCKTIHHKSAQTLNGLQWSESWTNWRHLKYHRAKYDCSELSRITQQINYWEVPTIFVAWPSTEKIFDSVQLTNKFHLSRSKYTKSNYFNRRTRFSLLLYFGILTLFSARSVGRCGLSNSGEWYVSSKLN